MQTLIIEKIGDDEEPQTFETDGEIRIGRDVDADVEFPAESTDVGHDHFRLYHQAGVWKFGINSKYRVRSKGKDIFDGQEVDGVMEVQLGGATGPKLRIEAVKQQRGNAMPTADQGQAKTMSGLVEGAQKNIKMIAGIGAAVAVVVAAAITMQANKTSQNTEALSGQAERLDTLLTDMTRIERSADFSSVLAPITPSVYLVDFARTTESVPTPVGPVGTAWVVERPSGERVLATNAHVAEAYYMLEKGLQDGSIQPGTIEFVVRSPEAPHDEIVIEKIEIHPGWELFQQKAQQMMQAQQQGFMEQFDMLPAAYDVALLIPKAGSELPTPLTLADEDVLTGIKPGMPVGLVGYPSENLITSNRQAPNPTRHTGNVTSQTDFFLSPDSKDGQLIQHSIPNAGGASGSPIVNADGVVVAINNAMNFAMTPTGRTPNAAMINFAQRVDLVAELLDGSAYDQIDTYQKEWDEVRERMAKGNETLIAEIVESFKSYGNAQSLTLITENEGAANVTLENGAHAVEFSTTLEAGATYLIASAASEGGRLRTLVYDPQTNEVLGDDRRGIRISALMVRSATARPVNIVVIDTRGEAAGEDEILTRVYRAGGQPS